MTAPNRRFSKDSLQFLRELGENNNREWFAENKERYEDLILDPALFFIESMYEPLQKIAPNFTAVPKRVGGSLMRVYRDTRFSRDKTPYKTNVGIQFRHELGKDAHAPGFYLHLEQDSAFFGAGLWRPPSDPLRAIRTRVAERSGEWQRATSAPAFRRHFELAGESLQRPPRGFDAEHPLIGDIKRKDFIAVRSLSPDDFLSSGLKRRVLASITAADPFMRFLCAAVGAPMDDR